MERCYPTGCPPCDGPIDFPENPSDGQRFCIPIGSEGNTKCWVWDACVPAWRAEGPSETSTRFRGGLDPNVSLTANGITVDTPEDLWQGNPPQPPVTDVAPGDWWVITTATNAGTNNHPDFAQDLAGVELKVGDRVFFDGSVWDYFPPPIVPYAEAAQEGLPLDLNNDKVEEPDPRTGGIVKNATVEQAIAGVNKCDTITPYTLRRTLDSTLPTDFAIQWEEDITELYVSIDTKLLSLSVLSDATFTVNGQEIPSVGEWVYKYYDVTAGSIGSGNEVELFPKVVMTDSGGFALEDSFIADFQITPVTGQRRLQVRGTFYDIFGNDYTVDTKELVVKYSNAMKITQQPVDIDTQSAVGPFSSSVIVEPFTNELPFDASKIKYQWYVWEIAVEAANDPDLNYEFSGFETNTLTAKRTSTGAETVQIRCEIRYGDDHPQYEAVFNEDGKLVITTDTGRFAKSARAHDAEAKVDHLISEPALLKGPTERVIKETTRTIVERETIRTVAAPAVGARISVPQAPGASYLTLSRDQYGRVNSLTSSDPRLRIINTRQTVCGKCSGISDRRLKENIMPIGEYLCS